MEIVVFAFIVLVFVVVSYSLYSITKKMDKTDVYLDNLLKIMEVKKKTIRMCLVLMLS